MRTLYRLADRGILKKEDLPWKGKRKPNGHSEKRGKQALSRDFLSQEESPDRNHRQTENHSKID